jgi:gp16 family phage-associated protein
MNFDCTKPQIDSASLNKIRDGFRSHGVSIAGWAKANNLSAPLVHRVLGGHLKCTRGESHRAAVLLGLKKGAASTPATYDPAAALREKEAA